MFCWQKVLFIIMRAASDTIIATFQEKGLQHVHVKERKDLSTYFKKSNI